jgi:hypothetical protein
MEHFDVACLAARLNFKIACRGHLPVGTLLCSHCANINAQRIFIRLRIKARNVLVISLIDRWLNLKMIVQGLVPSPDPPADPKVCPTDRSTKVSCRRQETCRNTRRKHVMHADLQTEFCHEHAHHNGSFIAAEVL